MENQEPDWGGGADPDEFGGPGPALKNVDYPTDAVQPRTYVRASGGIDDFLSHIRERGTAKTSHFDVGISVPTLLLQDSSGKFQGNLPKALKFRCETAEIPGRQIATTDNKIFGPIYKVPYTTIYAEMTMTFIEVQDMLIRKFFEAWADIIYDSQVNMANYPDDFKLDIFVTQYDTTGFPGALNPVLKCKLIGAFPTNINQLTVNWADDSLHKLAVTFFYERYEIMEDEMEEPMFIPFTEDDLIPYVTNDTMIELPEDEKLNDIQLNSGERASEEVAKIMIELPENAKQNDEQLNGMERARAELKNLKGKDSGLLGIIKRLRGLSGGGEFGTLDFPSFDPKTLLRKVGLPVPDLIGTTNVPKP